MLLYVYGTLRKNGIFHNVIKDCEYKGKTRVGRYKMVDAGAYPAALLCNDSSIVCEKYEVSEEIMEQLDEIEDCPALYERINISGIYMYVMHPWNAIGFKEIECGDWIKYLNKKE